MSMSKKDFVALADAVRPFYRLLEHDTDRGILAGTLRDFCCQQNSNFKPQRWLSYLKGECGPSGGKR